MEEFGGVFGGGMTSIDGDSVHVSNVGAMKNGIVVDGATIFSTFFDGFPAILPLMVPREANLASRMLLCQLSLLVLVCLLENAAREEGARHIQFSPDFVDIGVELLALGTLANPTYHVVIPGGLGDVLILVVLGTIGAAGSTGGRLGRRG